MLGLNSTFEGQHVNNSFYLEIQQCLLISMQHYRHSSTSNSTQETHFDTKRNDTHSTMHLTIQKTSMPSISSVGAQRFSISKHICTSRKHSMRISAAAASDATEVRYIFRIFRMFFALSKKPMYSDFFPTAPALQPPL